MTLTIYAGLAFFVAIAVFLTSEWVREPGAPAPDTPGLFAIAAGLLWPVVLVAALQFALCVTVLSRGRARNRLRPSSRILDRAA